MEKTKTFGGGLSHLKYKFSDSDEYYTPIETVENIFQKLPACVKEKKIWFPCDNDESAFVKFAQKERLIYKNKVKVALTKGKDAFEEAIYILEKMEPLSPLMFNNAIMIPHPTNEAQAKDTCYFRQQIRMIEKHTPLAVHFKEYIKEPDVSALLMIVDDVNKNPGKKRTALLNPNYKYIGISSVNFDKTFVAFFTFSL